MVVMDFGGGVVLKSKADIFSLSTLLVASPIVGVAQASSCSPNQEPTPSGGNPPLGGGSIFNWTRQFVLVGSMLALLLVLNIARKMGGVRVQ